MMHAPNARKNLYSNPSVLYGDIPEGDWRAPVPGWGMNPYWAGPSRVGVGEMSEQEKKASMLQGGLMIAGAVALAVWAFWDTGKRQKAMSSRYSR